MVSFVILHYKNIQDTLECIQSIKRLKTKQYSIVVVDNGTLQNQEKELLLQETTDVICNEENLGFAKGNNIGCAYAIDKYHPDFLVVLNNDIVLLQPDFIERIFKCYQKTTFDMMGPKIITNGGDSVNPFPAYDHLEEVEKAISTSRKLIRIYQSRILTFFLNRYFQIKHFLKKPKHLENGEKSMEQVALHGCCLIFSKKYYEKYPSVFYSETFLYHEEEFLKYRMQKNHLISYYDATIEVFHKEGASLNLAFGKKEREKLIFRNQEIIRSLSLLKQVMKEQKDI